jgi:hypothetical protein
MKPKKNPADIKTARWIAALIIIFFFAATWQIWFVLFALIYISIAAGLGLY